MDRIAFSLRTSEAIAGDRGGASIMSPAAALFRVLLAIVGYDRAHLVEHFGRHHRATQLGIGALGHAPPVGLELRPHRMHDEAAFLHRIDAVEILLSGALADFHAGRLTRCAQLVSARCRKLIPDFLSDY